MENPFSDEYFMKKALQEAELAFEKGEFKQGSDMYNNYVQLVQLQQSAKQAKAYTNQVQYIASLKNNQAAVESMAESIDAQNAYTYMNDEITTAVNVLAFKDAKQTMEADDFAVMKHEHKYRVSEMALKHQYDVADEQLEYQHKIEFENYKKSIGHSSYTGGGKSATEDIGKSNDYITKGNEADVFTKSESEQTGAEYVRLGGDTPPDAGSVRTWKQAYDNKDGSVSASNYKRYMQAQSLVENKKVKLQREANEAAVKFGKLPKYRNIVTLTDLQTFDKKIAVGDKSYYDAWSTNSYAYALDKFPNLTASQYNEAEKNASPTKPLYPQIIDYLESKNTKASSKSVSTEINDIFNNLQ
jgi:hypothetical protein